MGSSHNRRRRHGERGAVAVEFALIVPIFLSLVFGIVDFGFAINRYAMVNNAAREGVREASLGASELQIRNAVARGTADLGGTVTVTISCKLPDGTTSCTSWTNGHEPGGIAEVKIDFRNGWVTPIGRLAGPELSISRTAKMRIE